MAKSKFIVVKSKSTQMIVERVGCGNLYNNFQIGYEAGKLSGIYPENDYIIYLEEVKK
jgi:hypothetical protein